MQTKIIQKKLEDYGYLFSILIAFLHVIPAQIFILLVIAFVPLCVTMLMLTVIISNMKISFNDIVIELFGICYILGFMIFIPLLYGTVNGKITIWYLLLSAWGSDILAYSVGRRIGKHKFTKISPNKSIEGCIAGIIGSVIFVTVYTICINVFKGAIIPYGYVIGVGIILSILGQCGDLAASSIKRETNIKDFGNLIPGHGGILDRMDSIIFMAPVAYILLMFF